MNNSIFIVSWPAAVGKTTICLELLKRHSDKIEKVITTTSRAKREWETDWVHYHFLSKQEFEQKAEAWDFIEYAAVHTNLYGSTEEELQRILAKGKSALYIIDVQGMIHLKTELHKRWYALSTYFLDAPMMELERRLLLRGTENEESFRIRLATTLVEKEQAPLYDRIIENFDMEDTLSKLAKEMNLVI